MTGANRSRTAALLAGGIVVVATAVIVIFGFVPTPKYPLLAEELDPGLSGMIAYVIPEDSDRADEFGSRCVYVIELPEGQTNEITCREQIGWGMAWTDDGWLVVENVGLGLALIEPVEGGAFERVNYERDPSFLWSDHRQTRRDGTRVRVEDAGTTVVVVSPDGSTRDLFGTDDAPSNYRFNEAQWSPDGKYVLVVDTEGRIIVVAVSGDPRPRVVAETGHEYDVILAWYVPGNATYTVDREDLNSG
ncbi:MAG: hypothetical protein O6923_05645 [Actinobacteria bacterium]|nr:hypothetical protein [Actinomycetota bacterium]